MKVVGAVIGILLGVVVLSFVLGFIATGGEYVTYRFWAPKQENAERVVFQNTNAYIQGKATYINRLYLDYQSAEGPQKEQLRRTILSEASTVDTTKLPADARAIVDEMEGVR